MQNRGKMPFIKINSLKVKMLINLVGVEIAKGNKYQSNLQALSE
jgi:hypothetical protein